MTKLTVYLAMMLFSSNFSSTTVAQDQPEIKVDQAIQTTTKEQPPIAGNQAAVLTEEEQRFVDMVNSERWSKGLKTLKVDPLLISVSREHSKEMWEKNYFDHYSSTPGKRTAMDRYLVAAGKRPKWAYLGENLFYCSVTDVNRGHKCLMDSPTHRENILNPRFETIGVGIYHNEHGEFWVTEMFLAKTDD